MDATLKRPGGLITGFSTDNFLAYRPPLRIQVSYVFVFLSTNLKGGGSVPVLPLDGGTPTRHPTHT